MTDIVERAKAALEGVTEGPWRTWWDDKDEMLSVVHEEPVGDGGRFSAWPKIAEEFWEDADARFIAAARQLVPELVAELEAARADNEVMFGRGYQAGVRQERENQAQREGRP